MTLGCGIQTCCHREFYCGLHHVDRVGDYRRRSESGVTANTTPAASGGSPRWFGEFGTGLVNFPASIEALLARDYRGRIIVERGLG